MAPLAHAAGTRGDRASRACSPRAPHEGLVTGLRTAPVETRRVFRAMNADVLVIVAGDPPRAAAAIDLVESLFRAHEAALSRFLPTSELSALNRSAGRAFVASHLLLAVVEAALDAAAATDGLFDPTVLPAFVAVGYDRSFERIDPATMATDAPPRTATWCDVVVDRVARTIELPPGCALDLGGIAKGWTVDRAAERLAAFRDFAVDAGGDLYAGGSRADGSPWTVGVADPDAPGSDLLTLAVRDEAVATSSVARRRWHGGHHLIDPRHGRPARGEVVQATVVSDTVAGAETLAKAALLAGEVDGLRRLVLARADGVLVRRGGWLAATDGIARRTA